MSILRFFRRDAAFARDETARAARTRAAVLETLVEVRYKAIDRSTDMLVIVT